MSIPLVHNKVFINKIQIYKIHIHVHTPLQPNTIMMPGFYKLLVRFYHRHRRPITQYKGSSSLLPFLTLTNLLSVILDSRKLKAKGSHTTRQRDSNGEHHRSGFTEVGKKITLDHRIQSKGSPIETLLLSTRSLNNFFISFVMSLFSFHTKVRFRDLLKKL